jgi:hypothetical protein
MKIREIVGMCLGGERVLGSTYNISYRRFTKVFTINFTIMKCCYQDCPNEADGETVTCKSHKVVYGTRENKRKLTVPEIQERLKQMGRTKLL